ncbi:asparagine synthetase B [Halobacillus sp. A1]|uniref:asparagine synthase-related protein n=1 Tax=Halobacillus sp. A1 TaxID=2880262 RepID=UPI0020A68D29|nr:asparagine synthase-related protein [Halobacillus sp. A1]MCP3030067.1 asparagine synthetase B [Halobacillus sp. A1]
MSAISGIINFNRQEVSIDYINKMMGSYKKYQADSVQKWSNHHVFLCCHNQWITPESVNETLPYYDYERKLSITADAIIDNRAELLAKLDISQVEGKFISDSQLILLAYYKWDEDVVSKLLGDFSFMIWDERNDKLFGARDFSGARTLYFYTDSSRFAFSTTMQSLFSLPYINKNINEEWLAEFLAIPTMVEAVDMSSTVYQSINQVPPSHSVSVQNGKVSLSKYKAIGKVEPLKLKSNEEYIEAFHEVFNRAVTERIRTYGEVGSHLSGGLDSGTVVSFAANELKKEGKKLHTFSYIPETTFEDWTPKYYMPNEKPLIKETMDHVGNIDSNFLSFEGRNPLSEVDDFLDLMEMPYKFFENTYWLKGINEEAHTQNIKVLLNGARGNHSISWGSWQLNMEYYTSLFKKLKWKKLNNELNDYTRIYKTGKSNVLPILTKRAFSNTNNSVGSGSLLSQLINPNLAKKTNVYDRLLAFGMDNNSGSNKDLTEYRRDYYEKGYVWNKSGVAETNLSLRYGLWNRDPTNDINVIKFCLSVPDELYVKKGMERYFIREATKNILPENVRLNYHRRGLQGADTIHRMKRNWKEFLEEVQKVSDDSELSDLLNLAELKKSLNRLGTNPRPEMIFEEDFKLLTRGLIVSRFIKNMSRKEVNAQ